MVKESSDPSIKVSALAQGTVIDHLAAGSALRVLEILGIAFEGAVTIGMNLESAKMGLKDIIKIERREITPKEVAKIALVSPRATFSIIRQYQVVEKFSPTPPRIIEGLLRCKNPSCISQEERVTTKFIVMRMEPLTMRCHYCERTLRKEEVDLL